jgi:hypothetical protein
MKKTTQEEIITEIPVGELELESVQAGDLETGGFGDSMPEVNTKAVEAQSVREALISNAPEIPVSAQVSTGAAPKKRGRPRKNAAPGSTETAPKQAKSSFVNPSQPSQASPGEPVAPARNGQRELVLLTTKLLDGVLIATLSDEMTPTESETELAVDAWEKLYVEKDVRDLPPWAALTVIYSARLLSRSTKPAVKDRMGAGLHAIGRLFGAKPKGTWAKFCYWLRGLKSPDSLESENQAAS